MQKMMMRVCQEYHPMPYSDAATALMFDRPWIIVAVVRGLFSQCHIPVAANCYFHV